MDSLLFDEIEYQKRGKKKERKEWKGSDRFGKEKRN
jgi:hypothetical protein